MLPHAHMEWVDVGMTIATTGTTKHNPDRVSHITHTGYTKQEELPNETRHSQMHLRLKMSESNYSILLVCHVVTETLQIFEVYTFLALFASMTTYLMMSVNVA